MSGVCIDKLPHSCGTRHGLQVYADPETNKVDGFCFSCKSYVANPYGKPVSADEVELPEPKTAEEIAQEIAEVDGYPVVDVVSRRLRAEDLDYFGYKVAMDERDGKTPYAIYAPMYTQDKLTGYYGKTLGKEKITWALGEVKKAEPFGWYQAKRSGAYRLYIFEGKEDAVAARGIFRRYVGKEDYMPAIIALPNGVNSVKSSLSQISEEASKLFREIVIIMDKDAPGNLALEEAMQFFPNALTAELPEKDANDCVIKGASKAAYNAMSFSKAKPKNTRIIIAGEELHQEAREPTPFGELTWPWDTMNEWMRNIRYGETIYIGAAPKMGKSDVADQIAAHLILRHKIPVFMAKPEQQNKQTYKKVCSKIAHKQFDDPKVDFDYEAYDKAGEVVKGKLFLVNLYQHLGWDSLKKDIVAAVAQGAKAVFIDPITNLTAGMDAASANTHLQAVTRELSALAMDLKIVVFIFCHLKANDGSITHDKREKMYEAGKYYQMGNCAHERGGNVLASQFAGSRAMQQACNLMIGYEGNKDPDLPEAIRRKRWLTILEDREFGNSNSLCVSWNPHTTVLTESR